MCTKRKASEKNKIYILPRCLNWPFSWCLLQILLQKLKKAPKYKGLVSPQPMPFITLSELIKELRLEYVQKQTSNARRVSVRRIASLVMMMTVRFSLSSVGELMQSQTLIMMRKRPILPKIKSCPESNEGGKKLPEPKHPTQDRKVIQTHCPGGSKMGLRPSEEATVTASTLELRRRRTVLMEPLNQNIWSCTVCPTFLRVLTRIDQNAVYICLIHILVHLCVFSYLTKGNDHRMRLGGGICSAYAD